MTEEEKKAIEFLETTKRSILVLGAKKDWEKEEVNNQFKAMVYEVK